METRKVMSTNVHCKKKEGCVKSTSDTNEKWQLAMWSLSANHNILNGLSDEKLISWINASGRRPFRQGMQGCAKRRRRTERCLLSLKRWECRTGWGRDVMNSLKEQHWTSDRKCDEAQRPPSAYQTDDFSLSDVVLVLSTVWWDWMIMPVAEEEDRLKSTWATLWPPS